MAYNFNFNNDVDANATAASTPASSGLKTGAAIVGGVVALDAACHVTNRLIDSGYNKAADKLEAWWNAKPDQPTQPGN